MLSTHNEIGSNGIDWKPIKFVLWHGMICKRAIWWVAILLLYIILWIQYLDHPKFFLLLPDYLAKYDTNMPRKVKNIDSIAGFDHEMNDRIIYADHNFEGKPISH